ncbi:MAG: hypothetical protein GY765_22290 [bacterium]|nr:hypothetical protein [bacterium]
MKQKALVLMCAWWALLLICSPVGAEDKVVVGGHISWPGTLDAAQSWDDAPSFFIYNIHDTLVCLDPETSKLEPSLATSWEADAGGTRWVFTLRKGVTFHDGTPFNADAVVFSFERQMDKQFKYRYYDFPIFEEIFYYLKGVKKLDDYTVEFNLEKPFYPFLAALTSDCASVVSPAAIKKYGKDYPRHPVGTGPFIFKSMVEQKQITLAANKNYWRGKPNVDKFVYLCHRDHTVLHRMFQERKLDLIFVFSISRAQAYKRMNWCKIHSTKTLGTQYFAFNLKNKYLKLRSVREAIRFAWDKRISKFVFQDMEEPTTSFLPPGLPGYRKREYPATSIKTARQLQAKENIKGPIKLTCLLLSANRLVYRIMERFSKNLRKAGIHIKIVIASAAEYTRMISKGNYDMCVSGWIADYPSTHSFLFPCFSSNLQAEGFANLSDYGDAASVMEEVSKAAAEGDVKKREAVYRKINDLIYNEILCIPIFHFTGNVIYNRQHLESITVNAVGIMSLLELIRK